MAATETVPVDRSVHSLHAYFLLAGKEAVPIVYTVTKLREGRSFSTRAVVASQDGVPIFQVVASFQDVSEEGNYEHQYTAPDAPDPETIDDTKANWKKALDDERLPEAFRSWVEQQVKRASPIDIRPINPTNILATPTRQPPKQLAWLKAHGRIGDNMNLHRCVAAYASDFQLLGTALRPHGYPNHNIQMMASLDHTMWFHAPFRSDEWLLYDLESPRSGHNRGFCLGRLFTREGKLVVSVAQEGVIRMTEPPVPAPRAKL